MENLLVGIEIGGSKLQICAGHGNGQIAARRRYTVAKGEGAAGIRRQIEEALRELRRDTDFAAVGVGYGGPVDWKTGRIFCSHHIAGWSDFPLGEWLAGLTQAPVAVDNDANVAALGEARHGAAAGFNPSFYMTLGSGVGGGLILDGAIYHGAPPGEAEIGHVRLDKSGTIVESRCSGWSVDAKVRAAAVADPPGFLGRHAPPVSGGEARLLAPALEANDAPAARILFDTAEDLAFALSHVSQLFHPAIIVLGGGLSLVGEPLRAAVEAAMRPYIMRAHGAGPKIALARLGEDAVPVGALALAALRIHSPGSNSTSSSSTTSNAPHK
jgi:glucokinase